MYMYLFRVDCYEGDGRHYQGTISETISGLTCQAWAERTPHEHFQNPAMFPGLNFLSAYFLQILEMAVLFQQKVTWV